MRPTAISILLFKAVLVRGSVRKVVKNSRSFKNAKQAITLEKFTFYRNGPTRTKNMKGLDHLTLKSCKHISNVYYPQLKFYQNHLSDPKVMKLAGGLDLPKISKRARLITVKI